MLTRHEAEFRPASQSHTRPLLHRKQCPLSCKTADQAIFVMRGLLYTAYDVEIGA